MKRVYHPNLNAWRDVDDVKSWTEQGWLTSKPEHVDDSDALGVGLHWQAAPAKPEPPAPTVDPDEVAGHTIAELREYADAHGIDLGGATKKADIVAVIEATA